MARTQGSSPQSTAESVERLARVATGELERFVGYAVLGPRFESGHVLALRRWAASSIGPAYTSVWHQLPDGTWRLYANAPRTQSCARYVDSVTSSSSETPIRLSWEDSYRLRVEVRGVGLDWEMDFRSMWMTRAFNAVQVVLPDSVLAARPVLRTLEWVARKGLGLGKIDLSGVMPNGQSYRALPRSLWLMKDSRAWFRGVSLGSPVSNAESVRLGTLTVPTSGALAFVSAQFAPCAGQPCALVVPKV